MDHLYSTITNKFSAKRPPTLPNRAHRRLMATKGIGPYAAGNLLKLVGHYDPLSLDRWIRPKFAAVHGLKKVPDDSAIQRHYRRVGRWQGLVLWLDLTRDWFEDPKRQPP